MFEPRDERTNRPAKYCSRQCGRTARYSRVVLACSQCGQDFERKRYMAHWSQERGPFCGFECYGRWQAQHTRGPSNPFYNPARHQLLTCDYCGTSFHRPKWIRSGELHFCTRHCFQHFAKVAYRRGLPRSYGRSWISVRKQALRRDHHQCQDCGAGTDLVVHHKRPYKSFESSLDAHVLDNLVTLCRACHRRLHNQLAASGH